MSERVWNPDVGDLHRYIEALERKVAALTAETERLRAQRNKAYAESDTNHAGMVAAQEDAMKMRERTRALEAALSGLVKIKDRADGRLPNLSNQGQGMDGYTELAEYRGQIERIRTALTEPQPPQEEPR